MMQRDDTVLHVIFVCTGNTCRSPMAAGLFRLYLQNMGLQGCAKVESAGLAAAAGAPPSENAVKAAAGFSANISAHRSRPLIGADITPDTRFVCMTPQHAAVLRSAGVLPEHILALSVSDPFMGDEQVYRCCAEQLNDAMPTVFRFVFGCDGVRRMQPQDAKVAAAIEQTCFAHPWSETALRESLENPNACFFLLTADGRPAGYIGADNISGEVYMNNLAVLPEFRRRGFGRLLLSVLVTYARTQKAAFVTLEVREGNIPAVSLYRELGFQQTGIRKNFYRDPEENALILTLSFDKKQA